MVIKSGQLKWITNSFSIYTSSNVRNACRNDKWPLNHPNPVWRHSAIVLIVFFNASIQKWLHHAFVCVWIQRTLLLRIMTKFIIFNFNVTVGLFVINLPVIRTATGHLTYFFFVYNLYELFLHFFYSIKILKISIYFNSISYNNKHSSE